MSIILFDYFFFRQLYDFALEKVHVQFQIDVVEKFQFDIVIS